MYIYGTATNILVITGINWPVQGDFQALYENDTVWPDVASVAQEAVGTLLDDHDADTQVVYGALIITSSNVHNATPDQWQAVVHQIQQYLVSIKI